MEKELIKFSKNIEKALKENKPIVGLETTIISHGMPYPENVKTALEVEEIIKDNGCEPMTIGIVNGKIKCGLTNNEIEMFGSTDTISKCTERDISSSIKNKLNSALTVGACLYVMDKLGIEVLVTGGIGGVSRSAFKDYDISADLVALSSCNNIVVCSGMKAFMGIKETLEYLETNSVLVSVYNSDTLPLFYSRSSQIKAENIIKDHKEIIEIYKINNQLGLRKSILLCNPIEEEYSLDLTYLEEIISKSIINSEKKGIFGKDLTPFILNDISIQTGGKTLESNVELIKSNAKLGSKISFGLCSN
jgi:pseudouridine-5'-phosphate glycosidase|tara:strand:+ start:286 stop:1200 length:915 start_codon:yes stop_codon:yes gene_type:complete